MKKIIEIDAREGFELLLGTRVMLMCLNYFYVGKLVGVNRTCLKLEDVSVVYETGEWGAPKWKDAQPIERKHWYLRTGCIESFGPEEK